MHKSLPIISLLILILSGCQPLLRDMNEVLDVSGGVELRSKNASLSLFFSDKDKRYIRSYYGERKSKRKSKKVPPGLAKRKNLPPGLQKQIERNGRLPPGLEGRGLPEGLEGHLSILPQGYVRMRVGQDLVLMNKKTGIVLDVMLGIAL